MSNVWIVARREFLERVRTKGFIISTVAMPLFMAAMFVVPAVLAKRSGREVKIALVNEAAPAVGAAFQKAISAGGELKTNTFQVEEVSGGLAANREALNARVRAERLDGYVVLPADVVASNNVQYRARNISSFTVEREIRNAASEAVQAERLRAAGLQSSDVQQMLRRVEVQTARITQTGEEAGDAEETFFLGYILGFMVYLLTILYGMNVLRSVLEEKTNRIVEVIVSSMKAEHLMMGKVLGVASVALLQVGIWAAVGILAGSQALFITSALGLAPGALDMLTGSAGVMVGAVGFFIFGFMLYSALFAALGAAVNSEQEAQQLQTVVLLPLIVPMLFIVPIIADPQGTTATVLGIIPFTAPVVMPMRMAATAIPPLQIVGSLVLLLASVGAVTWLAGKIYRVGILSTGKKPTLTEMVRWLRAA